MSQIADCLGRVIVSVDGTHGHVSNKPVLLIFIFKYSMFVLGNRVLACAESRSVRSSGCPGDSGSMPVC